MAEKSVENIVEEDVDDNSDQDDSECIDSSGRASKSCDYSKHLLETSHSHTGTAEGRWLKSYYHDEVEIIENLSDGISIMNHTSLKMWSQKR